MKQVRATSTRLRTFGGALLALALLTFPACQFFTDFVIVNDSGAPVEVRYSFKHWRAPDDCCPQRPSKKSLDQLGNHDAAWKELQAGEFQFDRAAGVVTVTLAPAEALRVDTESGWRGHGDRRNDENFKIASLRITGTSGSTSYEGMQAQYQFQWQDDNLYKLTYYGWGDKRYDGGS